MDKHRVTHRTMLVAAALALCPAVAFAAEPQLAVQSAPMPRVEDVTVPAITGGRDPKVVGEGWKHFYFYRPDTSYEQAYADFADCYRFLPVPYATGAIPMFVPWEAQTGAAIVKPSGPGPYGLVGDVIGAMVAGPIIRRQFQSRMRRCMEPRGYQRYPADEATWEKIIDNYSARSIAVQAKLVAQGQPDAEPLAVTR